jgi:hypothetical protein
LEKEWHLRDVGDAFSENMQAKRFDVDTIDEDLALTQLNKSEQGLKDRGLASACSTDNSYFHAWLDRQIEVSQGGLEGLAVSHCC